MERELLGLVYYTKTTPCIFWTRGYQKCSFQFVSQDFDLGITGGSGRALATDVATWM